MKITTFDPLIVSKDAESIISLFEELGFEKRHNPTGLTEAHDIDDTRMVHPEGFCIDIAETERFPKDLTEIRINVDDFDEAYNILKSHGFTNTRGDDTLDSESSKAAAMIAPSGFMIALVEHIK